MFSSNRLRLPWNKTVSQGGLASLASSIIKQLHGNVSTVSMEVITSNKGGQKILLNGYMYTKKVTRLTGIWWSCVCARTLGCKGTVKTSLVADNPQTGMTHNHDSNAAIAEATKAKVNMKKLAMATRESSANLVARTLTSIPEDARVEFPQESSAKKTIRHVRAGQRPPVPDSLQDLLIDGAWATTGGDNPERFEIFDNGQAAACRIIAFASMPAMRLLATADTWFVDGNFSMAPRGFMQLYVIRVPLGTTTVSAVYALMERKSQQCYQELFQAILDYCDTVDLPAPSPSTVLCDFELAVIRALRAVLPPVAAIQGCFYHLTQATWRQIQELGLSVRYQNDGDLKLFCGKLDGLAFLPIADVPAGMNYLLQNTPDGAEGLVDYFSKTYVTGTFRHVQPAHGQVGVNLQRMPPRFPPELWNVHEATVNGAPRTNNQCEGWNNRFFHLVGYKHPSIWTLIEAIQMENQKVVTLIAQDLIGQPPRKRIRRQYVSLQTRLIMLCQDRVAGRKTIEEFLTSIGHNIGWTPTNRQAE